MELVINPECNMFCVCFRKTPRSAWGIFRAFWSKEEAAEVLEEVQADPLFPFEFKIFMQAEARDRGYHPYKRAKKGKA
jgi:hypothetical protein